VALYRVSWRDLVVGFCKSGVVRYWLNKATDFMKMLRKERETCRNCYSSFNYGGRTVPQLVEALCHMTEGFGFDSR
jgi:hypothetical protein